MMTSIRKFLASYINAPFVSHTAKNDCDVANFYPGYHQTFGDENPDKTFYVIWLERGGSGFFSNVFSVLCHISIAERLGMTPVVDFQNYKTLYNETVQINNTSNAWEYYFQPVSDVQLSDVYRSKNVFFSSGRYPNGFSYSVTQVPGLYDVFERRVKINEHVERIINDYTTNLKLDAGDRVLGIHFRGQEQKLAPLHSFPPT